MFYIAIIGFIVNKVVRLYDLMISRRTEREKKRNNKKKMVLFFMKTKPRFVSNAERVERS